MAIVYVFAEQIRDLVLEGKQEITLPEDARISAAAWDLIKEKQVKVNFIEPEPPSEEIPPESVKTVTEEILSADTSRNEITPDTADKNIAVEEIRAQIANAISEFDEADVEVIIEKVLQRLQHDRQDAPQDGNQAGVADDDDDLVICRCEEITRGEIKDAIRNGMTSLSGIKRVTRAGMGLCQGQTCQELVMRLLAEELGLKPHELEPITARGPVRPLRLDVFANS